MWKDWSSFKGKISRSKKKLEELDIEIADDWTKRCAVVRYFLHMDIRTWKEKEFTDEEILQMWSDLRYVKKTIGEWKE